MFFFLLFPMLVAAPFLAIAYICLRRQYRKLFLVLGVVGAIAVFGLLMALPDQMGITEYVHHNLDTIDKMRAHRWLDFLAGPFFLLCLFGPIYAAAWFYRLCRYLAYRGSPGWEERIRVKTQGHPLARLAGRVVYAAACDGRDDCHVQSHRAISQHTSLT